MTLEVHTSAMLRISDGVNDGTGDGSGIHLDSRAYSTTPTIPTKQLSLRAEYSTTNEPILTLRNTNGYLRVGPQNASFCHFYTDRNSFYFNKPINLDGGSFISYDEDLAIVTDAAAPSSTPTTRVFIDAGVNECRVGIGNGFSASNLPQSELHVEGAVLFRAPIEVNTADPTPTQSESGTVFIMENTGAIGFTLPLGTAGVQFIVINTAGNNITFSVPTGSKLNGTVNGTAVNGTANGGTTLICRSAGVWFAVGGI